MNSPAIVQPLPQTSLSDSVCIEALSRHHVLINPPANVKNCCRHACLVQYVTWAELLYIQLLTPNASFLGHLAGILAGMLHVTATTACSHLHDELLVNRNCCVLKERVSITNVLHRNVMPMGVKCKLLTS